MPSLKTAFGYLIVMGLLGLILAPLVYGYYLYAFWDHIDEITGTISLTLFGLGYFGQMCGVVVLQHLESRSESAGPSRDSVLAAKNATTEHPAENRKISEGEGAKDMKIFLFGFTVLVIIIIVALNAAP